MTAKLGRRSAGRGSALGLLLTFAASACSGQISAGAAGGPSAKAAHGGSGGNGESPSTGGPGQVAPGTNPGNAPSTCAATQVPGVTPLLKLSTAQYKNTVRDLLTASGAGSMPSSIQSRLDAVPDDSLGDSFRGLDDRISLEHVQTWGSPSAMRCATSSRC